MILWVYITFAKYCGFFQVLMSCPVWLELLQPTNVPLVCTKEPETVPRYHTHTDGCVLLCTCVCLWTDTTWRERWGVYVPLIHRLSLQRAVERTLCKCGLVGHTHTHTHITGVRLENTPFTLLPSSLQPTADPENGSKRPWLLLRSWRVSVGDGGGKCLWSQPGCLFCQWWAH